LNEIETVLAGLRAHRERWYADVCDELIVCIEEAARRESPALPFLLNAGHLLIGSRGATALAFIEDPAPTRAYAKLHQLLMRSAEWQEDIDARGMAINLRKAASHVARAETLAPMPHTGDTRA